MKSKKQILNMLIKHPARFGNLVGFSKLGNLHNDWIRKMILCDTDKTLQAHRNSYKTTCVSLALAIIMICFPNKRILFVRKTDDDVKEIVKQVKKILLTDYCRHIVNQLYGVNFYLTVDNATELSTNLTNDTRGTSQLVAMGIGSSMTGKHFDIIFTDDIVTVKDRISKKERDTTKTTYQELQNLKTETGRIFNTGTPWHKEDCFTLMPEAEKYDWKVTGIFTVEQIKEKKEQMLPSLFAANYELRHIASEDVIFENPVIKGNLELAQNGICHVDSAFFGEDFTALTFIQKKDGHYYVFGKLWRKHVEKCYNDIIDLYNKMLAQSMWMENNADKGFVARDLRKKGLNVHTYHESTNKFLKITSVLKIEWNKIIFVEETDKEYIEQILDYNENAEHDDAPDSLASLVRRLYRKTGNQQERLYNKKYI